MAEKVAELVAEVNADTDDFDEGMRQTSDTVDEQSDQVVEAQREQQGAIGDTSFEMSRLSSRFLQVSAIGATALGGLVAQSNILQNEMGLVGDEVSFLADEVAVGLGLDDVLRDAQDAASDLTQDLAHLNEEGQEIADRTEESDFDEAPLITRGAQEVKEAGRDLFDLLPSVRRGGGLHRIAQDAGVGGGQALSVVVEAPGQRQLGNAVSGWMANQIVGMGSVVG